MSFTEELRRDMELDSILDSFVTNLKSMYARDYLTIRDATVKEITELFDKYKRESR